MFLRITILTLIAALSATDVIAIPSTHSVEGSPARAGVRRRISRTTTANRSLMPNVQNKSVEEILADPVLWGKDFPTAIAAMPAFNQAGEQQVAVFPNRIVGRTKERERVQAESRVSRLDQSIKTTQNLTPRSTRLATVLKQARVPLKAEVILLPDDRTFRLAATGASPQFIAPGLKIADVRKRLGKEERVATEVLDDGTERRPVILTLHYYAGGSIIFAESDVNPNIGAVDRVFLNAATISTTIF